MIEAVIGIAPPVLLAALGGLITDRAGTICIALEGFAIAGAFAAHVLHVYVGNPLLGIAAAVVVGMLFGGLYGVLSVYAGANPFVVGLGVNLVIAGTIPVIATVVLASSGASRVPSGTPLLPIWIGAALAAAAVALFGFLLRRTRWGLRLRALGADQGLADDLAIDSAPIRMTTAVLAGALAAAGGSLLSLELGSYVPNMAAGRGWIALALVYLGLRRPLGAAIAAVVFAFAQAFTTELQTEIAIPGRILGLPFLLLVIAIVVVAVIRNAITRKARR